MSFVIKNISLTLQIGLNFKKLYEVILLNKKIIFKIGQKLPTYYIKQQYKNFGGSLSIQYSNNKCWQTIIKWDRLFGFNK